MNFLKTLVCVVLFAGALAAALWPIFVDGKVNWLYDMDIDGGVQIAYQADFSSVASANSSPVQRRELMARSHERLDGRLAQFQGADVRVQILGEDKLLVEVPGVHNIDKVRADLGKPQVVSFARVTSIAAGKDAAHQKKVSLSDGTPLWVALDAAVVLGGNILYDEMKISKTTNEKTGEPEYGVSLPLDDAGAGRLEKLTDEAFDKPAVWFSTALTPEPEIVLLLDQEPQKMYNVVDKGIRQGRLTAKTLEDVEVSRRLLSAGPMPVGFNVISERHISPLVGQRLRGRALLALPISLLVLFVLIGAAYLDRPWFLFVYAATLIFWLLCLIGLANFHLIRMSLLQLAGFSLLLGMNSDSLVLVFEDLREKLKRERRFRLDLIGHAFRETWGVVFWGMIVSIAVVLPLAFQGDVFTDFVRLLLYGMGFNILGYIFARLLMSLEVAGELATKPLRNVKGLTEVLDKIDFARFLYFPLGICLMVLSVALLFKMGIPQSTVFGGGESIEISFPADAQAETVQSVLEDYFGRGSEILCEQNNGMTHWAQVRFPRDTTLGPDVLTRQLSTGTGMQPRISPAVAVSRTLIEKTRFDVSWPMFAGMAFLGVVCMFVYSGKAGLWVAFALVHDFLICLLAMVVFRVRLDLATTAALAAMVGYSIYDSIVVLHRLRNLKQDKEGALHRELSFFKKDDRAIVEQLPAENLRRLPARVVLASSTTALPMIVLAIVGGGLFDSYAVIVTAGAVFGTLSSVYMVGRTLPWAFVNWGRAPG